MFDREHGLIRRMVQAKNYVLTHHAFEEMIADGLHVKDIEQVILKGTIIRIEIDKQNHERKYIIFGKTCDEFEAEVVVKIKRNVVIITVYML